MQCNSILYCRLGPRIQRYKRVIYTILIIFKEITVHILEIFILNFVHDIYFPFYDNNIKRFFFNGKTNKVLILVTGKNVRIHLKLNAC